MKSFISILTFLTFFIQTSSASIPQINYQKFEEIIKELMTEFHVPGIAVGIVSKDKALYMKGFGVRGVDEKLPVTADTQFAIGSTSKAFTATALGTLVDKNIVKWDAPIKANYLTNFEMMDKSATELVTIRDLLTHRTGLPRHDLVWYGTPLTREEIYNRIKYLQPSAGIREKSQYQNIMFVTAGYLLEQVTGLTWEDYVQKNIFDALKMDNSNFSVDEMQKAVDFSIPHAVVNGIATQIPFRHIDAVGPAGSINSSVSDMGKWLRLQLNGGSLDGVKIIENNTMAEIHRPQMMSDMFNFGKYFSELGTEHYAMGWFEQTYHEKHLIHHGGGIDGFITFVGYLPELDRGIVVFGNSGSIVPYMVAFSYMDLLIKGEAGPWVERLKLLMKAPDLKFVSPTPLLIPIDSYFGTYSHPAYGDVTISQSDTNDTLIINHYVLKQKLGHKSKHSFLPVQDQNNLLSDENKGVYPITFVVNQSGEVTDLLYKAEERTAPIRFNKRNSEILKAFISPFDISHLERFNPLNP